MNYEKDLNNLLILWKNRPYDTLYRVLYDAVISYAPTEAKYGIENVPQSVVSNALEMRVKRLEKVE